MVMSIYAHGVGPPGELPMSVTTLGLVAAAALVISFAALVSGWQKPLFPEAGSGSSLLVTNSVAGRVGLIVGRALGVLLLGTALVSCFVVADDTLVNIAPRIVFVALWVFVPVGSAFLGDLWRWMSPFEMLAGLRDRRRRRGQRLESACSGDVVGGVSMVGVGISPTCRQDSFDRAAACVDRVEWDWGMS